MLSSKYVCFLHRSAAVLAIWSLTASIGLSQANNNNNNNNNNNGGLVAGIDIDAQGVLRVTEVDPTIAFQQRMAALQSENSGQVVSPLRKVSLNRLERYVAEQIASGNQLSDEALGLAGLTRIEYVFLLPDSNDIVIAGPAEKVHVSADNRFVGLKTGKATLRLEDLVIALRAFSPNAGSTSVIGCSIDPTKEGLKRMQQYNAQFADGINNVSVQALTSGMKDALGYQTVSIKGVPRETHFAQVLVEADYRMKLIGLGLENPMVQMSTWIERTQPGANANALQRWFFEADYSSVATNEDRTALRLTGRGVKLVGEKEQVGKDGQRSRTRNSGDSASQGYTKEFTQKFDAIANAIPVFGEMRNLFDMSIAAAFIQQSDMYSTVNWDLGVFASEDKFSVCSTAPISQVESAINAVWKGAQLITPIGGGVHINAAKLISSESMVVDQKITGERPKMAAPATLEANQWWWD